MDTPATPSATPSSAPKPRGLSTGCLLQLITGAIVVVIALAILERFANLAVLAKRSELPVNVNAIREAQLEHQAETGHFLPCSSKANARSRIQTQGGNRQRAFNPDGAACWKSLGWEPDGMIRGEYWVEVSPDGADFTVSGISDLNMDNRYAVYEATKTSPAERITRTNIY